jgi:hypothetical protein
VPLLHGGVGDDSVGGLAEGHGGGGGGGGRVPGGGLYKLANPVDPQRLKAPGFFNPWAYEVKKPVSKRLLSNAATCTATARRRPPRPPAGGAGRGPTSAAGRGRWITRGGAL